MVEISSLETSADVEAVILRGMGGNIWAQADLAREPRVLQGSAKPQVLKFSGYPEHPVVPGASRGTMGV